MMTATESVPASQSLRFDAADMEVRAQFVNGAMTIQVVKSGACVHKLTIDDAAAPMEHSWIADLFAREERIELSKLVRDADDYISDLNINQG